MATENSCRETTVGCTDAAALQGVGQHPFLLPEVGTYTPEVSFFPAWLFFAAPLSRPPRACQRRC